MMITLTLWIKLNYKVTKYGKATAMLLVNHTVTDNNGHLTGHGETIQAKRQEVLYA